MAKSKKSLSSKKLTKKKKPNSKSSYTFGEFKKVSFAESAGMKTGPLITVFGHVSHCGMSCNDPYTIYCDDRCVSGCAPGP